MINLKMLYNLIRLRDLAGLCDTMDLLTENCNGKSSS
jgi:hypothetical protein